MTRARLTGFAFAAAASLATTSAFASDPDPWFGSDKALHFGVSAVLAGSGYAVSALVLDRPWQRAVAGGTFSLTLGAGKELYDLSGHGDPSWKDFTWDVIGTTVGLGIALLVNAAISGGHASSEPKTAQMGLTF